MGKVRVCIPQGSVQNSQIQAKPVRAIASQEQQEQELETSGRTEAQPMPAHTPLPINWADSNNLMRSLDTELEEQQLESSSLGRSQAVSPQPILQRSSQPSPLVTQNEGTLQAVGGLIQRDLVDKDAAAKISSQDVAYELIAHRLAYKGTSGAEKWLDQQGYEQNWRDTVTGLGLFVGLLMPKEGSGKRAVLAFKGTQPDKLGDVLADLDPVAVGFAAFKANQSAVEGLMKQSGGKVDVVGHSLGGALAQQAASAFPGNVGKVVTFQAPGITQEQVRQFNALPPDARPEVNHHIASGDIVDLAGGKHLGGSGIYTGKGDANFFMHHISPEKRPAISSHTKYLLQDDQFTKQKEEAGIDDNLHQQLGIDGKIGQHRKGVEQYNDNPFWFRQFTSERAREFASPGGALAIGGAALAKQGRKNWKAGSVGNKVLGAAQMAGGGVGALVGGVGALAGGLVGGTVGVVGGGLGYAGQGVMAGGKALAKGAKAAGKAVGRGALAVGGAVVEGGKAVGRGALAMGEAVVEGGKAVGRGALALGQSALNFFGGRRRRANAA